MPLYKLCARVPQRWMIVLACFLGLFVAYKEQVCLSIAIIQMVVPKNHTYDFIKNETHTSETGNSILIHSERITSKGMRFDWDEQTQGYIFSAYYWGLILSFMLGGPILDKLGAKRAMAAGTLLISLFTLLIPKSVEWYGAISLIALRFLGGLGAGMVHPAMMKLFSRWIPEDERSFAAGWAYAGGSIGSIIGMAATGTISERFESGWPAIFYVYGSFGMIVFCIQCAICYDSPSEHPCISKSEVELLKKKLKNSHTELPATPWHLILRSKPIWAILIALIGNCYCQVTMVNYTPKFMNRVLNINAEANGYLSSIPHVGSLIFNCIWSWIADRLIATNVTSIACARKFGNTIASVGTGFILVLVTYVGSYPTLIVGLYIFASILFPVHHVSTLVNTLDVTPNYAGAIQGILLAISSIAGLLAPYVAGWLLHTQTVYEWRNVFFVVLVISAATNLFFVIFGKGEVQEWNDPKTSNRKATERNDRVTDKSELFAML